MIQPIVHKRQSGWFAIDHKTAESLFYAIGNARVPIPGIVQEDERVIVHRTHLSLVERYGYSVDAIAGTLKTESDLFRWAERDRIMVPVKLRTTQQQAIDFIEPRRGSLLGDEMRLGKGHPVGTNILGPRGWMKIEDLCVGSQVIGSNGDTYRVTGVYRRGVLPVYRVTFSDGSTVKVDGDHLWSVWTNNWWHRGSPSQTRRTTELRERLYDGAGNAVWRIPMVQPIKLNRRNQSLDPYVLGVLLGDGTFRQSTPTFTLGDGDEEIANEVGRLLPVGTRLVRRPTDRAPTWGISRVDPSAANPVTSELQRLGLWDRLSPDKFVPDDYLFGDVEQRLAVLQGLMDTDGEMWLVRKSQVVAFSSSSELLAGAVQFLVESLGGVARRTLKEQPLYKYRGETRIGLPSHRLTISMPDGLSPFRMRSGYEPHVKFPPSRLIRSIEPDDKDEVICISVDAPDQLYVTEHCIVTHNTLSAIMCHDPKRGPLVVIAPLVTRGVWLGWLKKRFPDLEISVMIGHKYDREKLKAPIIYGHYDILSKWQAVFPIGTLILDEAHVLANRNTKRSKGAVLLASRAEKVIATTGTPIWDMPMDMWNILGMLAPGAWGSYWDFGMRYGAPVQTGYGVRFSGSSNADELRKRLSEIMIRRLWRDCQDDLPAISRSVIVADVDDPTRRKLDLIAMDIKTTRAQVISKLAVYRSHLGTTKLPVVLAEIAKVRARGEPIVVWTWHKELAHRIISALEGAFIITGELSEVKREAALYGWRNDPSGVLVATMASIPTGIDLSHARIALFAEIDYVPTMIAQAEMRTYAPDRAMAVSFVVANHIVDLRMVRALVAKLSATDPLGLASATNSIDALSEVLGGNETPDMSRFLDDVLAGED